VPAPGTTMNNFLFSGNIGETTKEIVEVQAKYTVFQFLDFGFHIPAAPVTKSNRWIICENR